MWLEWLAWMSGDGSITGAGEISQLCIPDLSDIQLLSYKLHSCAMSLWVAWADMLHHTGWALRNDQQRNIWADMEPQNIWKWEQKKSRKLNFCYVICSLIPLLLNGHPYIKKKVEHLLRLWFRFGQLISSFLESENYVLNYISYVFQLPGMGLIAGKF